jgi:hypothetical protein
MVALVASSTAVQALFMLVAVAVEVITAVQRYWWWFINWWQRRSKCCRFGWYKVLLILVQAVAVLAVVVF